MSANYPDIACDKYHIDILTANFVLHPDWFDVVVASNLFGDILSAWCLALVARQQHQSGANSLAI